MLLQVRDAQDSMREQEVGCFAAALSCDRQQIRTRDLLSAVPSALELSSTDMILLGGSGRYSATANAPWLDHALDLLRLLHTRRKPTFASCWGFQAMARALGGTVIHDPSRAELGTHAVTLTAAGKADPLFGALGDSFEAQMGHEDVVVELPRDAVLLAS
ncbi:MAG TPA: type 1 glutamine amidotransferase, partial [Burkholderiaceae bacterium]|nr:type 1 glutamine amidotransferase [Burkholderiaceae bacterium]